MRFTALSHRRAILLLLICPMMWSSAGVVTRHLSSAQGFEVTFWRSLFAALFMVCALAWQHGLTRAFAPVIVSGRWGLVCGAMWATMFTCFMLALTRTSTANTLIVMSLFPLFAALLSAWVLKSRIAAQTWIAIALAVIGVAWMFAAQSSRATADAMVGVAIAFGIPVAAAINIVVVKRSGAKVDLVPAVLIGGVLSAAITLPFAWPLTASLHDVGLLAFLGVFQLGFPCMLMVMLSPHLEPTDVALISLLEVVLGPLWTWLFANEAIGSETLIGGGVVIGALVLNELAGRRNSK
jgi:drug/metabolite transporter (DMT)-like permease